MWQAKLSMSRSRSRECVVGARSPRWYCSLLDLDVRGGWGWGGREIASRINWQENEFSTRASSWLKIILVIQEKRLWVDTQYSFLTDILLRLPEICILQVCRAQVHRPTCYMLASDRAFHMSQSRFWSHSFLRWFWPGLKTLVFFFFFFLWKPYFFNVWQMRIELTVWNKQSTLAFGMCINISVDTMVGTFLVLKEPHFLCRVCGFHRDF